MELTETLVRIILGAVTLNLAVQAFFLNKLWNHEKRVSCIEGKLKEHLKLSIGDDD